MLLEIPASKEINTRKAYGLVEYACHVTRSPPRGEGLKLSVFHARSDEVDSCACGGPHLYSHQLNLGAEAEGLLQV